MLKYILLSSFALFLLASPASAAEEASAQVGTIMAVEGNVLLRHGNETVTAAVDTPVQLQDTVETGAKSKVLILMIDDTQLTLGEKAKFIVNQYAFDEDAKKGNKASYSVLNGAFSYVSGLMGHSGGPADVNVSTGYGNIGIRGTWFFGGVLGNKFGLFLQEGQIGVDNAGGGVVLGEGQGTDIGGEDKKPGAPETWPPEKIKKLKDLVKLQDEEEIKARIAAAQGKQKQLREKHKKAPKKGKKYSLRLRNLPRDTDPPGAPFIPCGGGRGRGGAC